MKYIAFLILALIASGQSLANTHLYVIQKSDTLASVLRAKNYGESYIELLPFIDQVLLLNPEIFASGNANFVRPGTTIKLPENPNKPTPQPVMVTPPEPIVEAEPIAEPEPVAEAEPVPEPGPTIPLIGNIMGASGQTEIQRDDETVLIFGTEKLYLDDVVLTHQSSLAEITLLDNTRFIMGPDSEFTISEYDFVEPKSPNDDVLGSLVASFRNGVLRTITGLIGKVQRNQFQIDSTLSASIGIRGTDFTVRSCNQIETCADLYGVSVAVRDGSIGLKNASAEIELKQNEFALVRSSTEAPGKAPLPEGFFDLSRDISEIATAKSWWQKSIDYLKSLF